MLRDFRKPLIIMTPKSLLRHKLAVSSRDEFLGDSHFMRIKSDMTPPADAKNKRLVLCSGKVAYDLMEARDSAELDDVSIVRIEQLYPFPGDALAVRLKRMKNLECVVWAQEEPRNNGAWFFVESLIEESHFKRILSDRMDIPDGKVRRLVLCSGKVAYDLIEKRDEEGLEDVSIVRLEQLYPFPGEPLAVRLKQMTGLEQVIWCQEEPRNNGAWFFVESRIEEALNEAGHGGMRPCYAGRDVGASPATGLAKKHAEQQQALVALALGLGDKDEARRTLKTAKKG
jgi:2-oxoglutarate dehydrogenase complex dehydrogenase (E1) component-like enzyme